MIHTKRRREDHFYILHDLTLLLTEAVQSCSCHSCVFLHKAQQILLLILCGPASAGCVLGCCFKATWFYSDARQYAGVEETLNREWFYINNYSQETNACNPQTHLNNNTHAPTFPRVLSNRHV